MSTQIGSFSLGGIQWKIIEDNNRCAKENSCEIDHTLFEIYIRESKRFYQNIESILWVSITNELLWAINIEVSDSILNSIGSLINQARYSLIVSGDFEGSVNLGGSHWTITTTERSREFYGYCEPETKTIVLQLGERYDKKFIERVLWHELIHAIFVELGLGDSEYNVEKVVVPFGVLLYEAISTFKMNYPDEYNNKTITSN